LPGGCLESLSAGEGGGGLGVVLGVAEVGDGFGPVGIGLLLGSLGAVT
jgi:hypothetical protein